jgi:branched-chain amino acid aminotransferase
MSDPDRTIWLDGELVPWGAAQVHVLSHSMARGSLVFDYMSVHQNERGTAIFRLDDHVGRFLESCELVGLPLAQDAEALRAACIEAARANPGARVVKLNAFLPSVEVDVVPMDDHVAVAAAAYDPWADVSARKSEPPTRPSKTVRLWLEKERKQRRPDIMHPHAKVAANYASPMVAKWQARRRGFDEVLLVDEQGMLAEGPTTNFFLVDGEGSLHTPPEQSVLLGVTRRSIIAIAEAEGRKIVEERIHPDALWVAAEAFLTGTSAGVWPIESVDERPIGSVCPGPISELLGHRFREITAGRDERFAHWLTYLEDV